MKKVLIVSNLITFALLLFCWFYCCRHCHHHVVGQVDSTRSGECIQPVDPGPFEYYGPDAVSLVKHYTEDHWMDINNSNAVTPNHIEVKDSRCVWFSMSRIKGFISAIESHAGGCCDTLGIRLYFGEYDDTLVDKFKHDQQGFDSYNAYRDKTTLIMIPTYRTGGVDHDFNPLVPTPCNSIDTTGSVWKGTIMALAMNHGGIIPPPYPSLYASMNSTSGLRYIYRNSGADFMVFGVDDPFGNVHPNQWINQTTQPSSGDWFDRQ